MDSFIAVAGWTQHSPSPPPPSSSRAFGHFRSLSSVAKSPSPKPFRSLMKSTSTSELPAMDGPVTSSASSSPRPDDGELSTLPDPRSRTMSPAPDGPSSPHHPDLNSEVATLSNKLIDAINHQTTLDDSLSATRSELDQAREQIKILEQRNATQSEMLAGDMWVRKRSVEEEKNKLLASVAAEKTLREEVEREKKRIEQELENLTTALFEEANKMVITAKEEARQEQDTLQRKNDQLRAQISDTEALLKSQQEQLAELKHVMEQLSVEREEHSIGPTAVTAPSSPGFSKPEYEDDEHGHRSSLSAGLGPAPSVLEPVSPTYPTSFHHLIQPVLRTDLALYDDFTTLARLSSRQVSNRISSGSMTGVGKLGAAIGGSTSSSHLSNASTSSLPPGAGGAPVASSPQTPNTPASIVSAGSTEPATPPPPLKETKFYKRVLTEDVEPTLRLDLAPGLSWLARRSVLSAMSDGSIVVEPLPSHSPFSAYVKPEYYACSLCGDTRKDERYLRTYRFRTSESDTAQRYPLCKFCLGRVRSTCEFLSFLRILKDGHWRTDKEDVEKAAWEESVRLREQMFWSRLGGGVVPTGHPVLGDEERSPRPSHESHGHAPSEAVDNTPARPQTPGEQSTPQEAGEEAPSTTDQKDQERPVTPTPSNRLSTQSLQSKRESQSSAKGEGKRLSITIPRPE